MLIHTQGVYPKFLDDTFPNEDAEIKDYRRDVFNPITKGAFSRAFTNLYRVFSESSYTIQASQRFKEWLDVYRLPGGLSLTQYLFKNALKRRVEDPNGLLIPYPFNIATKAERVDVRPHLVLSRNILYWDSDMLLYQSSERTPVLVNKAGKERTMNEGLVFVLWTKEAIYLIEQHGRKGESKYRNRLYYKHGLKRIPAIVLGGQPETVTDADTNTEGMYFESDFSGAVAHGNEALRNKSIHQAVTITCSYPIKVMQGIPCNGKDKDHPCSSGKVFNPLNNEFLGLCTECGGTGYIAPSSPYKGIVLRPSKKNNLEGRNDSDKFVEYLHPDVSIIKVSGEEADADMEKMERNLHLRFVELAQSGVAKEKDREDKYSMLFDISSYFFRIVMQGFLNAVEELVFPDRMEGVVVNKPYSLEIKTEDDLAVEFTGLVEKGAPIGVIIKAYLDYVGKRFAGNELQLQIEKLCIGYAPIYIYPIDKRGDMLLTGFVDREQYMRALYVNGTLQQMADENPDNILKGTPDKIYAELDRRLARFFTPPPAPPPLPEGA